ncbi:hypothetical protein CEUSTIGMA_g11647.t1 [Chlamydomonas eustigma]|uniref:Uncharacterized protein n=1 Tax=Chlamydomonas eustigma TaxID=1157962 RepID=A0A250XMB0_9CHLO|nr:hypothetical protein CEUSTIGMA_g11647.t1 [Chlamydomonas eustigma]|eukprot:GAX84224.1 hypothetical protein CEUSTIGMA_g11647.t1 [Chlamydomonas eustigma]
MLTWNEFQRKFQGRWKQKELSQKYTEYKREGLLPDSASSTLSALDEEPPVSIQRNHCEDVQEKRHKVRAREGLKNPTTLSWNQFQAKYKGLWSREELSKAYARHKVTGHLPSGDSIVSNLSAYQPAGPSKQQLSSVGSASCSFQSKADVMNPPFSPQPSLRQRTQQQILHTFDDSIHTDHPQTLTLSEANVSSHMRRPLNADEGENCTHSSSLHQSFIPSSVQLISDKEETLLIMNQDRNTTSVINNLSETGEEALRVTAFATRTCLSLPHPTLVDQNSVDAFQNHDFQCANIMNVNKGEPPLPPTAPTHTLQHPSKPYTHLLNPSTIIQSNCVLLGWNAFQAALKPAGMSKSQLSEAWLEYKRTGQLPSYISPAPALLQYKRTGQLPSYVAQHMAFTHTPVPDPSPGPTPASLLPVQLSTAFSLESIVLPHAVPCQLGITRVTDLARYSQPTTSGPVPHPQPTTSGLVPHSQPTTSGLAPHPQPSSSGLLPYPQPTTSGLVPHSQPTNSGLVPHPQPTNSGLVPHPQPTTSGLVPHSQPTNSGLLPYPQPTTSGLVPHPQPTTSGLVPHPQPSSSGLLPYPQPTTSGLFLLPQPTNSGLLPYPQPTTSGLFLLPQPTNSDSTPYSELIARASKCATPSSNGGRQELHPTGYEEPYGERVYEAGPSQLVASEIEAPGPSQLVASEIEAPGPKASDVVPSQCTALNSWLPTHATCDEAPPVRALPVVPEVSSFSEDTTLQYEAMLNARVCDCHTIQSARSPSSAVKPKGPFGRILWKLKRVLLGKQEKKGMGGRELVVVDDAAAAAPAAAASNSSAVVLRKAVLDPSGPQKSTWSPHDAALNPKPSRATANAFAAAAAFIHLSSTSATDMPILLGRTHQHYEDVASPQQSASALICLGEEFDNLKDASQPIFWNVEESHPFFTANEYRGNAFPAQGLDLADILGPCAQTRSRRMAEDGSGCHSSPVRNVKTALNSPVTIMNAGHDGVIYNLDSPRGSVSAIVSPVAAAHLISKDALVTSGCCHSEVQPIMQISEDQGIRHIHGLAEEDGTCSVLTETPFSALKRQAPEVIVIDLTSECDHSKSSSSCEVDVSCTKLCTPFPWPSNHLPGSQTVSAMPSREREQYRGTSALLQAASSVKGVGIQAHKQRDTVCSPKSDRLGEHEVHEVHPLFARLPATFDHVVATASVCPSVVQAGRLRMITRESLPHDHDRLFRGFGVWHHVCSDKLRNVRMAIPFKPGLYEWGALAPGVFHPGSSSHLILAFYLGKAGSHRGSATPFLGSRRKSTGRETLRSRFNKYAVSGKLLGPSHEKGEKMAMFCELQRRGFSMWYRFRECESREEPLDLETSILQQVDYALNLQNNGRRRALILGSGVNLKAFPVINSNF